MKRIREPLTCASREARERSYKRAGKVRDGSCAGRSGRICGETCAFAWPGTRPSPCMRQRAPLHAGVERSCRARSRATPSNEPRIRTRPRLRRRETGASRARGCARSGTIRLTRPSWRSISYDRSHTIVSYARSRTRVWLDAAPSPVRHLSRQPAPATPPRDPGEYRIQRAAPPPGPESPSRSQQRQKIERTVYSTRP